MGGWVGGWVAIYKVSFVGFIQTYDCLGSSSNDSVREIGYNILGL